MWCGSINLPSFFQTGSGNILVKLGGLQEVLNWLYTEPAVKDEVVTNDRWGTSARHHHGGYYTTEYGSGLNTTKAWEENRGMAHSFGYSRTENLKDYNSSQELVYILVDIVSRGGDFLLDIGPTVDGRIAVIMQERLVDIGDWLKVNGKLFTTLKHGLLAVNGVRVLWQRRKEEGIKRCMIS